jgi:hypothetical protein
MEHLEKSNQPQAILYDNAGISLADFREELEQILTSASFEFRIGRELGGAGTLLPTLELILAFAVGATSTIISSALSELGKDIYHTLKGKLFKKPFENDSSMVFIITIVTDEMIIIGRIRTDNHKDVIEGFKNVNEIVDDASKINVSETEQLGTERIRDRDKLITDRCNFVFHYEYDASNAKWVFKKISRIEKVI